MPVPVLERATTISSSLIDNLLLSQRASFLILFSFDHNKRQRKASFDDARNAVVMCKSLFPLLNVIKGFLSGCNSAFLHENRRH